ncbi:MAG: hypothetical protein GC162_06210 [Planctomycetes bacterium]|nr:hypothetical protein [Planctomycetota bacterium]
MDISSRRELIRVSVRVVGAAGLLFFPLASDVLAGKKHKKNNGNGKNKDNGPKAIEASGAVPGKGYLRVAFELDPNGPAPQFRFTAYTSGLSSTGQPLWRAAINEGLYEKAVTSATRPIPVNACNAKISVAGLHVDYRVQLQFKAEDGSEYTSVCEKQGKV